jgi:hypothetical protein
MVIAGRRKALPERNFQKCSRLGLACTPLDKKTHVFAAGVDKPAIIALL